MINFLFKNLPTKIMALVLAVLVWGYLYNESTESRELEIHFFADGVKLIPDLAQLYIDNRENTIILDYKHGDEPTGKLKVKITGPKGTIKSIVKKGIECRLRITPEMCRTTKGEIQNKLTLDDFNLPSDVQVKVLPSEDITISYIKFITKSIKIVASKDDTDGTPADGYELVDVKSQSDTINVKIPANKDREIDSIKIEKINIQKRADSFTIKGTLKKPSFPFYQVEELFVKVTIEPLKIKREFPDIPFWICIPQDTNPFKITLLEHKKIKLIIYGPKKVVEGISPQSIQITLKCRRTPTEKEPVVDDNLKVLNISIANMDPKDFILLNLSTEPSDVTVKLEYVK